MIPAAMSSARLRALHTTLAMHHEVDVHVMIQDLNGNSLVNVSDRLLDGQVNVDATADITRSATVTLLDPDRALPFESDSPASATLYLNRMLHITYGVLVDGIWVHIPVFTGPVSKLDRSDTTIDVEAQGKEALAMGACWQPMTLPKGMKKTTALLHLMSSRAGESLFSVPDLTPKLSVPVSIARTGTIWIHAQRLAKSLNRHLFYDGAGVLRLRPSPATVTYTFTDRTVVSRPQISYSMTDLANTVMVTGASPKGSKRHYHWTAVAPPSHPLSPDKLGRGSVPRHLLLSINDDSVSSTAEAAALANSTLARSLLQAVDASFEALPIPHLEPYDLCGLTGGSVSTTFALRKFSLPLVAGPNMTVGFLKNLRVKSRGVHRR
jgi:hypothetical protein